MRVLVTGGSGFIGSNLAKKLAGDGHDVVAADAFVARSYANLIGFTGDILTHGASLAAVFEHGRFDVIFHQASITGVVGPNGEDQSDPHTMMRTNVEGFRELLDWAVRTKARVVWASSCSVYGRGPAPMKESQAPDPLNIYAFSKLTMERMAERYAPKLAHPIVGLRYSNVYGPGEDHKGRLASMIHQLARQMRAGKRPRIFSAGEQKRDFVYIDDAIQANLKATESQTSGVFNAGAGRSWSFNQVVAELNRVLKTDLSPDYFPNPYSFTQDWTQTDQTEARRALGYEPRFDLAQGIDAYFESGKLGISV